MASEKAVTISPIRFSLTKRIRVTPEDVGEMLFVLYFSVSSWEWLAEKLLEPFGAEAFSTPLVLAVIWLPVIALFPAAKQRLPADFFVLLLYLILYLCITYCFHRDYAYYYTREEYGLWDYVLLPDNGLYAYFFVRLVNDPKRILRGLRTGGYITYVYSALRLWVATTKGFWLEEGRYGQEYMSTYNMNYGYTLLLFVCCFLYCAFEQGSLLNLLLAGAGVFMILCGGSRGPLLDIVIFLGIYTILRFRRSRRKLLFLSGLSALSLSAVKLWHTALTVLNDKIREWNLHSRTLDMILAGTVAQNNGRDVFWSASWQMIRDNPLGYGAMGARHVLCGIHIVGHPHNFFIELIIEYGVVFGPLFALLLLAASLRVFLRRTDDGRQGVFLIFFANACQLMTSYTYWHSPALWAALAAGMCFFRAEKGKR